MYNIQSRVIKIDRRCDIQDSITSKHLPLAISHNITNAAVQPLVSACHRLLACPKHTHYMYTFCHV